MIKQHILRPGAVSLGLIRRQRLRIADLERRLSEAWDLLSGQPPEYMPEAGVYVELAWILARKDLMGRHVNDA